MSDTQERVLHAVSETPRSTDFISIRSGYGYDATRKALVALEGQGHVVCDRSEAPYRWTLRAAPDALGGGPS